MTTHKYVYLQGEDVIAVLSYDDQDSYSAGVVSGLDSGAIFVEVDENNPADQFWTWDGTTATSPTGETWTGENNG
jgi:hypothetical protein